MSCTATRCATVISPVRTSTSTSAKCAPNVRCERSSALGCRAPLPMTVLFSTLPSTSESRVRAPLLTTAPAPSRSSAFGLSRTPAAAPKLCPHAESAPAMRRRAAGPTGPPALPADLSRPDPIALEEVLVGVALRAHRVLRRAGVLPAQRERVNAHPLGELVDRGLERERALDIPRRAERRQRARVGDDLVRLRADVWDVVERVRRTGRVRHPLALS